MSNPAGSESSTDHLSPEAAYWLVAADYLRPDKSLDRIASNSKYVIATTALVASTLAGATAVTASQIDGHPIARFLALASMALSTSAVLISFIPLILRSKRVRVGNLLDVKMWFTSELRRATFVRAGGIALFLAIITAASAVIVLIQVPTPPEVTVTLSDVRSTDSRQVTIEVSVSDAVSDEALAVRVWSDLRGEEVKLVDLVATQIAGSVATITRVVKVPPEEACIVATATLGAQTIEQSIGCIA